MEGWKYCIIIVVCLCVAAYMFLSLFYPKLRWMFRMKRFAAGVLGVDEEKNEKFANVLGAILAPIVGLAVLGVAGFTVNEWIQDRQRDEERLTLQADEKSRAESSLMDSLANWKVTRVYLYDSRKKRDADAEGMRQAEEFVRALALEVPDGVVAEKSEIFAPIDDLLAIEMKLDPALPTNMLTIILDPEKGDLGLRRKKGALRLTLPDELREAARKLGEIAIIDFDALKKKQRQELIAEQRRKKERMQALDRHRGKSTKGTPAWELREKSIQLEGKSGEQAFVNDVVGMEVEWEVRLRRIRRTEAPDIEALGYQWDEKAKGAMYITLKVPKEKFPEQEEIDESWWVLAKGSISSIDTGRITVNVKEVQAIVPGLR